MAVTAGARECRNKALNCRIVNAAGVFTTKRSTTCPIIRLSRRPYILGGGLYVGLAGLGSRVALEVALEVGLGSRVAGS